MAFPSSQNIFQRCRFNYPATLPKFREPDCEDFLFANSRRDSACQQWIFDRTFRCLFCCFCMPPRSSSVHSKTIPCRKQSRGNVYCWHDLNRKNSSFISSACAENEEEEAYIANTITIPKTLTLFQVAENKAEESYTADTNPIAKKQQPLFVSNACKNMCCLQLPGEIAGIYKSTPLGFPSTG